jgi:protocatechuate 3,4-dioxygenase, beta subunit
MAANYLTRRRFLGGFALGAAMLGAPWALAEELARTPRQTEGPFYPDRLPLDSDNDLVVVNKATTPALGSIAHLSGRILDARGMPIRNALVEIWQVDNNGVYLHSGSDHGDRRDRNFQGFGRFETAADGAYRFRTIKPVPYPGRAPHIHFAVKIKGRDPFTTQCYVKGEPLNQRDGLLNAIRDVRARESVIVDFRPIPDSRAGELAARFDIVLGFNAQA